MSDTRICPRCQSTRLVTSHENVPPPHHGRLACGDCGRFIRWVSGPAADYRLFFGKHKGSSLAEIDRKGDRRYLDWLVNSPEFGNDKVRDKVREYLAQSSMETRQ